MSAASRTTARLRSRCKAARSPWWGRRTSRPASSPGLHRRGSEAGPHRPDSPVEALVQVLMGGILLGGLYALVASGLSLVYGVVRILNFSHGTLLAVGGVAASLLYAGTK